MDESVRRAMAKWPDVPAVFGWLGLDARGRWLLRGSPITNSLVNEFIGRNYAVDDHGRWFFQNGPQRVFVALEYAPWVLRVDATRACLVTHTGRHVATVTGAWMDREGVVVLDTEHGAGSVDDRDVESLAEWLADSTGGRPDDEELAAMLERIQQGEGCGLELRYGDARVPLLPIERSEVPARLRFAREPEPLPGERTSN